MAVGKIQFTRFHTGTGILTTGTVYTPEKKGNCTIYHIVESGLISNFLKTNVSACLLVLQMVWAKTVPRQHSEIVCIRVCMLLIRFFGGSNTLKNSLLLYSLINFVSRIPVLVLPVVQVLVHSVPVLRSTSCQYHLSYPVTLARWRVGVGNNPPDLNVAQTSCVSHTGSACGIDEATSEYESIPDFWHELRRVAAQLLSRTTHCWDL